MNLYQIAESLGLDPDLFLTLRRESNDIIITEDGTVYAFDLGITSGESPYVIKTNEELESVVREMLSAHNENV